MIYWKLATHGHLYRYYNIGRKKHIPNTSYVIFSLQVASTLKADEKLQKCPKCRKPAKVLPVQDRGCCTNPDCEYDFCTKCSYRFHHSKDCVPIITKKTKTNTIGTKKSKSSLKRLWWMWFGLKPAVFEYLCKFYNTMEGMCSLKHTHGRSGINNSGCMLLKWTGAVSHLILENFTIYF